MPDLVVLWIVAVAVTSVFDGVTLLVWVGVAAAVREDLHLANRDLELVSKVPNRHSVDDEESLGEDHPFGDSDHRGGDDRLVPLPIGREPLEPLLGEPKGMVNRFGGATAVHLEAKVQKAGRALRQTSPAFERMTKSLCVLEEESRFEPISRVMAKGDWPKLGERPAASATLSSRMLCTADRVLASQVGFFAHCSKRPLVLRRAS